jgi:putative ABC transport system permease protein
MASVKDFLTPDRLQVSLSYTDAVALMRAHQAPRQAAMFGTWVTIAPPDSKQLPFRAATRATYRDFFPMFDVPFRFGAPWSVQDDEARSPVVVLSRALNDRLFGGTNSVGREIRINSEVYRVVGVLQDWNPAPRFYDLNSGFPFGEGEQVYLPFTRAIASHMSATSRTCMAPVGSGPDAVLRSECVWTEVWVELPTAAAQRAYHAFLINYANTQRDSGRFNWPSRVALRNVRQWLTYRNVVSGDVSMLVLVSFAFLVVCLLNAVGLMLAKFMARNAQVSVRRALGADRGAIFCQGLVEAGTIGLLGGLIGLGLARLGLLVAAGLFVDAGQALTRLDGADIVMAVALSVLATLLAGLYPTWRAASVQPAWQLKVQ